MNRLLLSLLALTLSIMVWANPSDIDHVTKTPINYDTADLTTQTQSLYNAEMSMNIIVNGLHRLDVLSITGNNGSGRTLAYQHLLEDGRPYKVSFTEGNLPILVFGSWTQGYYYMMEVNLDGEVLTPSEESPVSAKFIDIKPKDGSTLTITIRQKPVTVTVNDAAGVKMEAKIGPNFKKVFFQDGSVEIDGASRLYIYNVAPYTIKSVKVNGHEISADEEGKSYSIEITVFVNTVSIEVEKKEVVQKHMWVIPEGHFWDTHIFSKDGTEIASGKDLDVFGTYITFTDDDLPLKIFGSWSKDVCKMTVSIDNEVISPSVRTATYSQYENVMVENGQIIRISIKEHIATLTVNEPSSIEALITSPYGEFQLDSERFKDGKADLNNISSIKIWGANGYNIVSVTVNGKDNIRPYEAGKYQVEISQLVETIDVKVDKTYSFTLWVDDLDKYTSLNFFDHDGEGGKTIATKKNLQYGENHIKFSSLDLPLQVKASWSEDKFNKMFMAIDDVIITPQQSTASTALFTNLNPENDQSVFISLLSESTLKAVEDDADKDRQTLQTLRQQLDDAAEQYSDYVVKEQYNMLVESILEWEQKVEDAANWSVIIGRYNTPLNTYEFEYLQYCVSDCIRILKEAKEADENLKKIEAAAKKDREEVKSARQASEKAINETDLKYPAFAIPTDKENILSQYDQLLSDIEKAYSKACATISEYQSPSVTETLGEIAAMVTQYQQDVKAVAEKAKEEATKQADADQTTLSALTAQLDELNSKYGPLGCMDTQMMNQIKAVIQSFSDKIDQILFEIFTTGKYQSPWSLEELQKIKDDITALEMDCKDKLASVVDKAAQEDLAKVESLKADFDKLIASLHEKYAPFCNPDKENDLECLFTTIINQINLAASKAKDEVKLYESPEVDSYLESTINAQMKAYENEVREKAETTMTDAEKTAQKDQDILSELKSKLEQAAQDYAKYVDPTSYQELSHTIELWSQKVDKAKEDVAQTGNYSTPWSQSDLESLQKQVDDFIAALEEAKKNDKETVAAINTAAQADKEAVDTAYESWRNTLSETQGKYPAFDSAQTRVEIETMFSTLTEAIEQAKNDAIESMTDYNSPSVNETLEQIDTLITTYQQEVEAAALMAMDQANKDAETDHFLLSMLMELVEGVNNKYAPLECIDTEEYNSILAQIQTFDDLIDATLEEVYTKGTYQTPWSIEEIKNLKESIQSLEESCVERLQKLVDEEAKQDFEKVENLRKEFIELCDNIHKIAGVSPDTEREDKIAKLFNEILEKIQKVKAEAVKNAQRYTSPDIADSLSEIDREIMKYKQEIIDQIIDEEFEILTQCKNKLQDIYDLYNPLYNEFLNKSEYYNLCQTVSLLFQRLQEAGEQSLDCTVHFQAPWTEEEINQLWNSIQDMEYQCIEYHYETVQEAANGDRIKVNDMKSLFEDLLKELDNMGYTDARNPNMEGEIESKLDNIKEKIEPAATDAISNTHPYVSPYVEEVLEGILITIEAYKNYVTGTDLTYEQIDKLFDLDEDFIVEIEMRLERIRFLYPEHIDMEEYQSIYDALHSLYDKMIEVWKEATISHRYTSPLTKEEIGAINLRIDILEQKAREAYEADGITSVEEDPQEIIYYDINGLRVKNPVKGRLYIRLQGGKAKKIIL